MFSQKKSPSHIIFKDESQSQQHSQREKWPRRLLHVPTMTSYEWQLGNKYRGIKEPDFNAISYTWGRYEDRNERPITIHGVCWTIPGIERSHFTIDEFQKTIDSATENGLCEFIWLDVACIDQENDVVKMDEINKQAEIYRRARRVFAWMVPWTTREMLEAFHTVEQYSELLGWSPEGLAKLEPWSLPVMTNFDSACAAFKNIAQQGWFTSLWTLQEGFLSRPVFLSKSSDQVYYCPFYQGDFLLHNKSPVGISWLAGHSRDIWDALRANPDPRALSICQSITDSGLLSMYYYKEPYLLYPAALKRYVSLPHDAVYAIMNAFELRMPSLDDVDELLLRLSLFLIQRDPIAYQTFIHQEPVAPSNAWRMSKSTHMPFKFFNLGNVSWEQCKMAGTIGRQPSFTGQMTTLDVITVYWETVQQQRRGSGKFPYRPDVFLDTTPTASCVHFELEDNVLEADDPDIGRQDDRYTERIPLSSLAQRLPFPLQSYRVLRLGIRRFDPPVSRTSDIIHLEYLVGLIVRQDGVRKESPWYRVGFTSWLDWIRKDPLKPGNTIGEPEKIASRSEDWQDIECLIG
jgi:hypothetical protein